MLASRGLRETERGVERIADTGLRERLRARARGIGARALLLTAVLTGIAVALPARD